MSDLTERLESRRLFSAVTGLPDPSFAGNGVATVGFFRNGAKDTLTPVDLLVDHGGRTYVIAETADNLEVRRLTAGGATDAAYDGSRGLLKLPVPNSTANTLLSRPAETAKRSTEIK